MTNKNAPELRFEGFEDDWEQRKLGEVVKITSGWSPSEFEEDGSEGDLYIKVDDLNYSTRVQDDSKMKVVENFKYKKMTKGSTIFPKRGAAIMTNKIRILGKDSYMDTNMMALEAVEIDSDFLYTFINRTGLFKIADTSTIPQINNKHIEPYRITLPRMTEQVKLGSFFKQLDNTIALHQRKIEQLNTFKKGYLQQLFPQNGEKVPRVRFANFEEDWEERKLGEILKKNTRKNKNLSVTNVESISNKTGFTRQTEQFEDYFVASSDLSNYYIIDEKKFAYNPSRINVGSIAYKAKDEEKSVVSPLYVSFSTNKDLDDSFLWYWFKTQDFEHQRQFFSEGGVRDTLSFNQLAIMSLSVPEIEEQQKIGTFFKQLDDSITLHQLKLERLKKLKQGFLQKMFI